MHVVRAENEGPEFFIGSLKEITSLRLEHGVLVADGNQLQIVLSLAITNKRFEDVSKCSWKGMKVRSRIAM
jgi:hypothetical protein